MKEKQLKELLRGMNIPPYRKDKFTKNNLEWLNKNLRVMNSSNSKFPLASSLIQEMLDNANYTS